MESLHDDIYELISKHFLSVSKTIKTNTQLGSFLQDHKNFIPSQNLFKKGMYKPGKIYLIGKIDNTEIFIDPSMKWSDTRIISKDKTIKIDCDTPLI